MQYAQLVGTNETNGFPKRVSDIALSTGLERPVASSALALQDLIERSLSERAIPAADFRRLAALVVGVAALFLTCTVFWAAVASRLFSVFAQLS